MRRRQIVSAFNDFKDISAGIQSLAIAAAAFLGGGWALYQFFSLRQLERARVDLEKAKKDLRLEAVIVIDVITETFEAADGYFLHTRIVVKNVGNEAELLDWAAATIGAIRYYKSDDKTLAVDGVQLRAWQGITVLGLERLEPGYSTSKSFLTPIAKTGIYRVEFAIPTSDAVTKRLAAAVKSETGSAVPEHFIGMWSADTFVAVPGGKSETTAQALTGELKNPADVIAPQSVTASMSAGPPTLTSPTPP